MAVQPVSRFVQSANHIIRIRIHVAVSVELADEGPGVTALADRGGSCAQVIGVPHDARPTVSQPGLNPGSGRVTVCPQ